MVTICLTCGDRGFNQVMVNCPKCQDSAQHVYCLDVIPVKYYDEDFTWVCDECKAVSVPSKSHHNQNSENSRKRFKKKSNRKNLTGPVAKTKVQICEGNPPKHEGKGSEDQVNSCHDLAISVKTPQLSASDPSEINEGCYIAAQPIINPAWGGSLSIMNKDFSIISGLVAHPSSLACAKVFEEVKLLPKLLFPDLVCRVDVWPKAFQSCGPSDQSIALFIFPDSNSNEKDFDNLVVSMVEEDLAMRAVLDNAELLFFTSSVLPEHIQRFQRKLYLWGAFRGKQSSTLTIDNASGSEKDLPKLLTCNTQSPVSPLSNNVHCGSESHY